MLSVFTSRRNRVCLMAGCDGPFVEKTFASADGAAREAAIYRALEGSGVRAASLLDQEGARLRLSFVEGEDYLALLERQEREGMSPEPWVALLEWIAAFHRATGLVQRDMNLRNFLWRAGVAVGLDFEDCGPGNVIAMPAQLAAFVLLYDPPHTGTKERVAACIQDDAIQRWGCGEREYAAQLALEQEKLLRRRRGAVPPAQAPQKRAGSHPQTEKGNR